MLKKKDPYFTCHCRACDSQNIIRDAELSWDVENQEWKISGLADSYYCANCEWTGEYYTPKTLSEVS